MASNETVCVVGLGYVGLPLVLRFGLKGYTTYGFDINTNRIAALKENKDLNDEHFEDEIKKAHVTFTDDPTVIGKSSFVVVAVPTPVDESNNPNLTLLKNASSLVGKHINKGTIVVFESTVYPGATEEECVPLIEKESGLKNGADWFVGYSPERVNPGDKNHTIEKIVKVVSGQDETTLKKVSQIYSSIIDAGVHEATSIKVAEAAKVIENIQRDINIGFMNELAVLFHKIGIPTKDVLAAAGTKWNFLKFTPGLVGGHCIGVDPYYLVDKAKKMGVETNLITAGRKINDSIPEFIANRVIKMLIKQGKVVNTSKVLVLGVTFKENISDTRNSKIFDTIAELEENGVTVFVNDPNVSASILEKFQVNHIDLDNGDTFDGIILATGHSEYMQYSPEKLKQISTDSPVLYDVRNFYSREEAEKQGFLYDSL